MRTILAIAAISLAAACSPATEEDTTPDTTTNIETPAQPSVIVITEDDARTRLEGAGYSEINGLTQNPDGSWTATATRDGESTSVSVGENGVSVVTTP